MKFTDINEIEEAVNASGKAVLKVIGVGGCGGNAIDRMIQANLKGVEYIAINTDAQDLQRCLADVKLQLGPRITKGLGAGGNCEIGEQAAQESLKEIEEVLAGADMVFVASGMGGGTGTGAGPIVAGTARELGAITVGVVTRPFEFEGTVRANQADLGVKSLRKEVDTLIVIPNDRLKTLAEDDSSFDEVMDMANMVLMNAVEGICSLISSPGQINLDFQDVRTVITQGGGAMMGTGTASGSSRAIEAAREAISSPLLDNVSIEGSRSLLVNLQASSTVKFNEFVEAHETITKVVGPQANVFAGMSVREDLGDVLKVTVIATGFGERFEAQPEFLNMPDTKETGFPFGKGRSGAEEEVEPFAVKEDAISQRNSSIPSFLRRKVD